MFLRSPSGLVPIYGRQPLSITKIITPQLHKSTERDDYPSKASGAKY